MDKFFSYGVICCMNLKFTSFNQHKFSLTFPCTDADRDKLAESGGKFAEYICKILDVYFSYHHDAYSTKGLFRELVIRLKRDDKFC